MLNTVLVVAVVLYDVFVDADVAYNVEAVVPHVVAVTATVL